MLKSFWQDETGATAIEYGLMAALVGLALIAGLATLGGSNGGAWDELATDVTDALNN